MPCKLFLLKLDNGIEKSELNNSINYKIKYQFKVRFETESWSYASYGIIWLFSFLYHVSSESSHEQNELLVMTFT